MPSKNVIKLYYSGAYYHLYNRGVNKRTIFKDGQDYGVFLNYLSQYLLPKEVDVLMQKIASPTTPQTEKAEAGKLLRLNNFSDSVDLIAFALMPNHFHLLVKQYDERAIESFMKSFMTRYTMYFNKRHKRVGRLFQGIYKAVEIGTEPQLLHLSRYIHLNPLSKRMILKGSTLTEISKSQPSSYPNYLGEIQHDWVKPGDILHKFNEEGYNSYREFVESQSPHLQEQTLFTVKDILLEDPE